MRRLLGVAVLAGLGFGAAGLSGCQSEVDRSRSAARSAAGSFMESLSTAPAQIDKTTEALVKATAGNTPDRAAVIKQFDKDVATLETHAASMARARDNAENRTQEYFRDWLKETRTIKSESERSAALSRYDAGQGNFAQAMDYIRVGARDFRSLMNEFNAAQAALKADPSEANAEKVRGGLGPIYDNAIMVKAYIARLEEQVTAALSKK